MTFFNIAGRKLGNILLSTVDIVDVVSVLIKAPARAPAIDPARRRAMIDKANIHTQRRFTVGDLFEIIS